MAGGVLAGPQRSCWGIWCVHHLDGCFWRILHKCSTTLLCLGGLLCHGIVGPALCFEWGQINVIVLGLFWHNWTL